MEGTGEISLADRAQIAELLARYARTLDGGDKEGFVALFAAGGSWISPIMGSFEGREEIAAWFDTYLRDHADLRGGQHRMSNVIIDAGGADRAEVWSNWILVSASGAPAPRVQVMGNYLDRLVKVEGSWLFERREIEITASE
ncbi:MAG TPA: nuclear transport factor 2 family protein [Solirubrobacterales bacterium]|nr:nuclear transport factor 2 family protein [Solirubrobacterales bacterium]